MLKEISERRNKLEPLLRQIVRTQLLAVHGKRKAYSLVLENIDEERSKKLSTLSYEELFKNIFFDDLRKIIIKQWVNFSNIFEMEKNILIV